jgi:hypothetical protein
MADTNVDESIISKITMATIGCKPGLVAALPDGQNELPIARLYGKLTKVGYQEDKASGQTYTYFVGTFEAVNMQSGEVFRSGKMFLPKGISELVEQAVNKNEGAAVSFAFQVNSIKANNPIKYSYKVLALKSPEAEDELKAIRELVAKAGTLEAKRLTGSQTGAGPKTLEGNPPARKSA